MGDADDQCMLQINEGENWTKEMAVQLAEQTVTIAKNARLRAEIGGQMILQVFQQEEEEAEADAEAARYGAEAMEEDGDGRGTKRIPGAAWELGCGAAEREDRGEADEDEEQQANTKRAKKNKKGK